MSYKSEILNSAKRLRNKEEDEKTNQIKAKERLNKAVEELYNESKQNKIQKKYKDKLRQFMHEKVTIYNEKVLN